MEFSRIHKKRMGANPAQVDRETGELFLNPDVWPYLPESFKTWILLHEEGHLKGGPGGQPTADEILADKYAFENFVGTEKESLRKSVLILHKTLPKHNDEQWKRIITMYARALEYDYRHYGNKQALEELERVRQQLKDYDHLPSTPIIQSSKSNIAPVIVAGIIGLVTTLIGTASKIYTDAKTHDYNESLADLNELHKQTYESDLLANEMIYSDSIAGISTNTFIALGLLVSLISLIIYLKFRYENK